MSVTGIDFGTSGCVIATIDKGHVHIVRNDLSERLTPTLVAYTNKERQIGEAAQSCMKSNYKNTCRYMKQLMGLIDTESDIIAHEKTMALASLDCLPPEEGSSLGYSVTYRGEQRIFTPTQCFSVLLTLLKKLVQNSSGSHVKNLVISVPSWYSDRARQAVLDASQIAGLDCLRTMNEHAAVALDYGIFRANTFDATNPSTVAFISIGHGSSFMCVATFTPNECKVLTCHSDRFLGGRDIDMLLVNYMSQIFEKQYHLNPLTDTKAKLKLEEAANKAKKILSANTEASYNIDCVLQDFELSGTLTRHEFETLCSPIKERITKFMEATFEKSGLNAESIQSIEIIGGACRIPWVQETISQFFKGRLTLSRTLSMDETVAKGCALQAAIMDPRFRVRDFNIVDILLDPIHVAYYSFSGSSDGAPELKTNVLFDRGSPLGSRKWLTFQRSVNFDIQLTCGEHGSPQIVHIELPPEGLSNTWAKRVKVCVKLTLNGIALFETAQLLVDEEIIEETPPETSATGSQPAPEPTAEQPATATKDGNEPQQGEAPTPTPESPTQKPATQYASAPRIKIKSRKYNCQIHHDTHAGYLKPSDISKLIEMEQNMARIDLEQKKLRETMNDLESYIFTMSDALSGDLRPYATETELVEAQTALKAADDWVYESTDDIPLQEYENKTEFLHKLCDPITQRRVAFNQRQEALRDMAEALDAVKQTLSPDRIQTEWSYIPEADLNSLIEKVDATEQWFDQASTISRNTPLHENCTLESSAIYQERDTLVNISKSILVPKPAEPEAHVQNGKVPEDAKTHPDFSQEEVQDPLTETILSEDLPEPVQNQPDSASPTLDCTPYQ